MTDGILIKRDDTLISLIIKAITAFLSGFVLCMILGYVLPPIFEVGEAIFPGTELEGIAWFFIIILFFTVTLILPSVYIYEGVIQQRKWEEENKTINIFIAVMIILTGLLLTYKGWFMIEAIPGGLEGITDTALQQFLTALYWVGAVLAWIEIIVITPIWIIIESLKEGE